MSVADKLQDLIEAKEDIKSAIESKGVPVLGGLSSYADAISLIDAGGSDKSLILFDGCTLAMSTWDKLPPNISFYNLTSMSAMFYACLNLTSAPNIDTRRVTDMSHMFNNCNNLSYVPTYNTNRVTNMESMFEHCWSLKTLPNLDTSNVTNMRNMFRVSEIEYPPIIDLSSALDISGIFDSCYNLRYIKFKGDPTTSYDAELGRYYYVADKDAFKYLRDNPYNHPDRTVYYDILYEDAYLNHILNDSNLDNWNKVAIDYQTQ